MKTLAAVLLALTIGWSTCAVAVAAEAEAAKNPVVFWELASHDAEKSVAFFEKVFEWKTEMIPNTIIHGVQTKQKDSGINGGIFTLQKAKLPFITIYIQVEDIEGKAKLIEESGGYVVEAPHEISPGLMICLFNDPSGVTFAMLERISAGE